MTSQKWSKVPWPKYREGHEVLLPMIDYERARLCTNSLSGLNPDGLKPFIDAVKAHLSGKPTSTTEAMETFNKVEQALSNLEGGAS